MGPYAPLTARALFLSCRLPTRSAFKFFLNVLAKKFSRSQILLVVDGAGNHGSGDLLVPSNVILEFLPAYSPELNPQENIWDEIREKIFKNYAAKSMDEVSNKLVDAALYIESNPEMVKSMTGFPYILNAL